MRSRHRRGSNRGLTILLGAIVVVFIVVAAAVGIKYAAGSLTSSDGKKASTKSDQEDKDAIKVTGIELALEKETVRAGEETKLSVTVKPDNATNKKLKWTVSGGGGTVSEDGIFIPAAEAGKSTVDVTATAADGSDVSASVSVRVLEAIDPEKPMVAVTYDDGPNAETTPTVLDALEENYAVATFFMQGKYIAGNEELLKRSYNMGNELANHSWDHPQLTTLSTDNVKKQLSDTDEQIRAAAGIDDINPILRPPYGAINDTVKSVVEKPIILWSLDTLDWKTRSTEKTYESCMTAKDGDIILMHDIHEPTVAGVEEIITGLQEKGFQLVTVTELYKYRNGDFSNGSVHYSMTAEEMKANEATTASDDETEIDGTEDSETEGEPEEDGEDLEMDGETEDNSTEDTEAE